MKIYIVVRWGNPYEEDRCDGQDTFFFVVARNHLNASRQVTRFLKKTEPECAEMRYQYLCNIILKLGEYVTTQTREYVLTGPFYEYFGIDEKRFQQCWLRDTFRGTFFRVSWKMPEFHVSQRERAYFLVVRLGNYEGNWDVFSTDHSCCKGDAMFLVIAKDRDEAVKISREYPLRPLDSPLVPQNSELVLELCPCKSYRYKRAMIIGGPYVSKFRFNTQIAIDMGNLKNK